VSKFDVITGLPHGCGDFDVVTGRNVFSRSSYVLSRTSENSLLKVLLFEHERKEVMKEEFDVENTE
jgi:hypothetical protein